MSDIPTHLLDAAATVCGYHTEGCEICPETILYHLERGRSEEQILADIALFRDDYPAWYAATVAAVNARRLNHG